MSRALSEHPAVFGAVLHQEVHYFDTEYARGLAWYRSHFPLRARARARLEGEAERIISDPGYASRSHQHHAYRTRGQYAEQLERFDQVFGRDRIHVVDCDAFFADPEPSYHAVLSAGWP